MTASSPRRSTTSYTVRDDGVAVKDMTPAEVAQMKAWWKAINDRQMAAMGYVLIDGQWVFPGPELTE
jgi:hypothetical protein